MGCLSVGLAALLALAIPASIAPASLVGAYVVIALLAAFAAGAVVARRGRRPEVPVARGLTWVGALAVAYAGVATLIHVAS